MQYIIVTLLFHLIPVAAVLFFLISLICYCRAEHKNKRVPGTYTQSQMATRRMLLVISSVIVGTLAAVVIGFGILLSMAITHM